MFPIDVDILFEAEGVARKDDEHLVCVAISLFNYAEFIGGCLESVASQTHRAIELIVVDDASGDGSGKAAQAWMAANSERFVCTRLLRHRENQGLSAARNTAFSVAAADHVMVLDADNKLYPRAVARLLEAQLDAGAAFAYPQLAFFGDVVQLGFATIWAAERLKRANYIDAMALVLKAAWAQVGGYAHLDIGWEDYDLWCKFIEHGLDGVFVPEVLCRYRVHGASMLRQTTNPRELRIRQRMMTRHPWLELDQ